MKEYFAVFEHPTSVKDMVYKNIKRKIIQGNFKPGIWLKEQELADAMEISRAPIREAFNQLERDGFINIIFRSIHISNIFRNRVYIIKPFCFWFWVLNFILHTRR